MCTANDLMTELATKTQRAVEVYIYTFFNFGAGVLYVQSHAPAALPPGKTRYPLWRRLGGPQGRYGQVWNKSLHRDSIYWQSSP